MTHDTKIAGNNSLQLLVQEERSKKAPDGTYTESVPLETFTLDRDDTIPLQFRGRCVGTTEVNEDATVGTKVSIFITGKGKIVTHIYQWQRKDGFQGEGLAPIKRSRKVAGIHSEPQEAFAWLIQDGNGRLGSSSRRAWEMACANWPALQGHDIEIID